MVEEMEIRKKLWNIDLVVAEIKDFPQTYDTILGEHHIVPTLQFMVRKKMNILNRAGTVLRATIPGQRFNRYIFYCSPKKYHIVVEGNRLGSEVYVFFDYEEIGEKSKKFYIKAEECWKLKEPYWEKEPEPKVIFQGNILKWI